MPIELVPAENMTENMSEINNIEEETKKRFEFVIDYFQKTNPNHTTELKHKDPYELLVATILSAQTTYKRINMTTPALFEKYPTIEILAQATPDEVYGFISSVNYANNKSNYLVRMAKMIITKYDGSIFTLLYKVI